LEITNFIKCPWCKANTRASYVKETSFKDTPIFCSKCKKTHLIDFENEVITKAQEISIDAK